MKQLLLMTTVLIFSMSFSFSAEKGLFSCEFIDKSEFSSCTGINKSIAFYSNGDETPQGYINAIISTQSQTPDGVDYEKALCCEVGKEVEIDFEYRYDGNRCDEAGNQFEFGFFESDYNSRLSLEYDSNNYDNSICLNVDNEEFASLDVNIVDEESSNLGTAGYNCIYRFGGYSHSSSNDNRSFKVSSCEGKYTNSLGALNKYPYVVLARLTPNIDSSTCNADCTSSIDNRMYSACANVIQACKNTPPACDGSLKGQWVKYDSEREILCEAPYDQFRRISQTTEKITVDSEDNACSDIVKQDYDVLVDAETITMSVYICND